MLARRQPQAAGPVFKATWAGLRTAWEYALKRAKISGFRPHDLRHTFASWAIQHGASLPEVKDLLGHATLQMTMRYAHLAPEHLRKATASLDGILDGVIAAGIATSQPALQPASQNTTGAHQPEATTAVL